MSGIQSYEELQENLTAYRQQLEEVEQLLLSDENEAENEELQDLYKSLEELIQLNEDLLKEALIAPPEISSSEAAETAATGTEPSHAPSTISAIGLPPPLGPPQLILPSSLPPHVAEQIRRAQVKAALMGKKPAAWAIGSSCQAMYGADGQFYEARVEGVAANGNFIVVYEGYNEKEEVPLSRIRPLPEKDEVYTGVAAPKRRRVDESGEAIEIPKWLAIKDTDDEKTKVLKRKKLRSYKSKIRFQKMDIEQKDKATSWQNFLKSKGSKPKTGFLTGTRKESIFKTPNSVGGKVGVVGSGRGMTDNQKRARHAFERDDE